MLLILRVAITLILAWLILTAMVWLAFFSFSLAWLWRTRRRGEESRLAIARLRTHRTYRFFFGLALGLALPVLYVRTCWQASWLLLMMIRGRIGFARFHRQPHGSVARWRRGNMSYSYVNASTLPEAEQEQFEARLEAGEDPARIFAEIEARLKQEEGRQ